MYVAYKQLMGWGVKQHKQATRKLCARVMLVNVSQFTIEKVKVKKKNWQSFLTLH